MSKWGSPEHRAKISSHMKAWPRTPAYCEAVTLAMANKTVKKKISRAAKKRWANPDFRKRLSKVMSEGAKKRWADPVKRAALLKVQRSPEAMALNKANAAATRL